MYVGRAEGIAADPPVTAFFIVVEDDIFCDLQVKITPRLATLDQLNRVIYARSFSKTLSGSLRVGFVACAQDIANELADIKMLTSITTSPFTERLIYLMLADGHYRKYLSRLHERWARRGAMWCAASNRLGWSSLPSPQTACSLGRDFPISRTHWHWQRRRNTKASCSLPARCFARISSVRRGCGSISPSAKILGCRAGYTGCGRVLPRSAGLETAQRRYSTRSTTK